MVENVSNSIVAYINSGGSDMVDLTAVVDTLGNLSPNSLWQMMEIKATDSAPLHLDLAMNPEFVFHWNMTLAFKNDVTHSFLMGMMPKNDTGG